MSKTYSNLDTYPGQGDLPNQIRPSSSEITPLQRNTLLFVMALFVIWVRYLTRYEPLERDIVTGILSGRALTAGMQAYVDLLEFKPPGSFVLWQILDVIFGTSTKSVAVINAAIAVSTLLGCYALGAAFTERRLGGLLAAGAWALIGGDLRLEANQPNLEVFINTAWVWAVALILGATSRPEARHLLGRYAVAGVLIGACSLIKHHVLATFFLMIGGWALGRWFQDPNRSRLVAELPRVLILTGAASIPWAVTIIYFWSQGRLSLFLDMITDYAVHYSHGFAGEVQRSLLENLLIGLTPSRLIPMYAHFLAPLIILSAIAVIQLIRKKRYEQVGLFIGWFSGVFITVSVSGKFFPHYYQLYLPALSIAAAYGIFLVTEKFLSRQLPLVVILSFVGVIVHELPTLSLSGESWSKLKYGRVFVDVRDAAQVLGRVMGPRDNLYVWGDDPGFYYYSDKIPPTGIFWKHWLTQGGPRTDIWIKHVIEDLERANPELVVVQESDGSVGDMENPVYRWIMQHYRRVWYMRIPGQFRLYVRPESDLERRLQVSDIAPIRNETR